ncbi:MAG: biotin transporter BioY [Chloroflexi bacterium]|nr:biotin transporter BioY [Chloroflexota bacterium]
MHTLVLERARLSTLAKILAVFLFTLATALSARVRVLLPFSPVPLTLQVLMVLLSGLALGWRGGLISQGLYLQAILLGAPWTAAGLGGPAAFVAPTAGYLLAFPLAAALAGLASERTGHHLWGRVAGGLLGLALIYALGIAWLSRFVGGLANGWRLGVIPFLGADALKVLIAASILSLRRGQ